MNIDALIRCFPLDEYPEAAKEVQTLSGPFDLAILSQLHARHVGDTVPVDYVLFELGEPPERHHTKIGGLPYRPADKPWPVCEGCHDPAYADVLPAAGTPMVFVGQIWFSQSRDLTPPDLPGDVLLLFTEDDSFCNGWRLEWYPLGLSNLTTINESPDDIDEFVTCFGHVVRTTEPADEIPDLLVTKTKIGGRPDFLGDPETDGQYLCQFGSVSPTCDFPAPWLGKSKPIGWESDDAAELMMVDVGTLFVLKTKNGYDVEFHCF